MSGPRVVVVGGGLAGLQAAITCADAGIDVTLLEARRRLGGATYSFTRGDLTVDNGQHVFLRCCTAYRAFLQRVGSAGLTELQERFAIPVVRPGGTVSWLRRGRLPAPLHLAGAVAGYRALSLPDRVGVARAALALRRVEPADPSLDDRTFQEWLSAHGQSAAAIAAVWNLIAVPTLNLPASRASLTGAVKVFRTGVLDARDAADIGRPRVPLSTLHGDAAARVLRTSGATVLLGAPVRGVEALGGGAFEVVSDGTRTPADAVVVAVPHTDVATLLPPEAIAGAGDLAGLGASPIVNLHVVYDRRVTKLGFAAALGSPVQWVFDQSRAAGLSEGQYLAVVLSAADEWIDLPSEAVRDRLLPAVADLFPRAAGARIQEVFVTRDRHATFAAVPGTARLRPGAKTRVPGLFLAGAWTDTGWPATMEGAVRSGRAAAQLALRHVGRELAQIAS